MGDDRVKAESRKQGTETVTLSVLVSVVTPRAIKVHNDAYPRDDSWIARSLITDCDVDLDDVVAPEEIEIEIPKWKARELRLA